ncbi:unnamed protein product [Lota lota]
MAAGRITTEHRGETALCTPVLTVATWWWRAVDTFHISHRKPSDERVCSQNKPVPRMIKPVLGSGGVEEAGGEREVTCREVSVEKGHLQV